MHAAFARVSPLTEHGPSGTGGALGGTFVWTRMRPNVRVAIPRTAYVFPVVSEPPAAASSSASAPNAGMRGDSIANVCDAPTPIPTSPPRGSAPDSRYAIGARNMSSVRGSAA